MTGITMFDMRKGIVSIAIFAAAIAAPAPARAQVFMKREAPRGWLGISYDESIRMSKGQPASAVTITEVAKGSPAERAGVLVGDTLVRVNDFRASTAMLQTMGASVEPGDTVRVVVRRGGHDRRLAIQVAKRPQVYAQTQGGHTWVYDADSVRGMMKIFVDSMYAGLDTTKMRVFRMDTAGFHNLDADTMFFGTMPGIAFSFGRNADSLHMMMPGRFFSDSVMRGFSNSGFPDSMFRKMRIPDMADSMLRGLSNMDRMMDLPPGAFNEMHTPDMVFRSIARSESAFAGADLTDINGSMGEYFGTKSGVLVLGVPAGTPAARAGLEPGDIVMKVDGTAVATVLQLRNTVQRARRGAPIKLEILRHQKARTIELNRE